MKLLPDKPSRYGALVAVTCSTLGLCTLGLISPLGLTLGLLNLRYQPRTLPIIAVVLGGLGVLLLPISLTLVLIFAWGFAGFRQAAPPPGPNTLELGMVAQQWQWSSVYPGPDGVLWTADDLTRPGELLVPEGTWARVTIRSDDVLHSLYIPAARVRQDVIPGRLSAVTLKPMTAGESDFFCTEYCGENHSQMTGVLRVLTQTDYAAQTTSNTQP